MHAYSNISLRSLLIGGFLICALLTGLSGGIGIYSLGQINTTMNQSVDSVISNVGTQNIRIQQLIPIRKMIADIFEATTLEKLGQVVETLQELEKKSPPATDEVKAIYQATHALADVKQNQLSALNDLSQLRQKNVSTLETITELTRNSVDTSVKESIEGIEKETQSISIGFGGLLQSHGSIAQRDGDVEKMLSKAGITDMMDELMMVSEMSISAVRAAMSVRSRANRQLVVINNIFEATDLIALAQTAKEIKRLKGEINSELVELPEDQTTQDIIYHLKKIAVSLAKMIEAKKVEIDTATELHNKSLDIRVLMGAVENNVIADGKTLTDNVTEKLNRFG